jgi:hypothetical protein
VRSAQPRAPPSSAEKGDRGWRGRCRKVVGKGAEIFQRFFFFLSAKSPLPRRQTARADVVPSDDWYRRQKAGASATGAEDACPPRRTSRPLARQNARRDARGERGELYARDPRDHGQAVRLVGVRAGGGCARGVQARARGVREQRQRAAQGWEPRCGRRAHGEGRAPPAVQTARARCATALRDRPRALRGSARPPPSHPPAEAPDFQNRHPARIQNRPSPSTPEHHPS